MPNSIAVIYPTLQLTGENASTGVLLGDLLVAGGAGFQGAAWAGSFNSASFNLTNGVFAASLTFAGTANRAIAFPNKSGTTTTGRAGIGSGLAVLIFGSASWIFRSLIAIPALSDSTETYTLRTGFGDSLAGEFIDGVFFRYTNGVNTGQWQCVTRSNNTETVLNTTVAVVASSTAFTKFEIRVNAAGTIAEFLINKVSMGTITTNIPAAIGRDTGVVPLSIIKSLGTVSRSASIDYVSAIAKLTTPRW